MKTRIYLSQIILLLAMVTFIACDKEEQQVQKTNSISTKMLIPQKQMLKTLIYRQ